MWPLVTFSIESNTLYSGVCRFGFVVSLVSARAGIIIYTTDGQWPHLRWACRFDIVMGCVITLFFPILRNISFLYVLSVMKVPKSFMALP